MCVVASEGLAHIGFGESNYWDGHRLLMGQDCGGWRRRSGGEVR